MEAKSFAIAGPMLLTPRKFADERGVFSEVYNQRVFDSLIGATRFVQQNHSLSRPQGTVRGLHFQAPPTAQGKLVRVVRGAIIDVAVDIRGQSPTHGQYVSVALSADNWAALWIPVGFAHGFCTLEPDTEVIYQVTDYYSQADERGIAWDDPDIGIKWPIDAADAVLSEKDRRHPRLACLPAYFSGTDLREGTPACAY
jgi:dTDP-4-dehydrorhamnose 3,5-epimerase